MTPVVTEIPLSPKAQSFLVTLGKKQYRFNLAWRSTVWALDIEDATGALIVGGIPLITGADLLSQYGYLGIGGMLWVQTDGTPDQIPSYDSLGVSSHLYFVSTQ